MKKKFTRGGGAPLVLTLLALIFSLIASFQEYLGRFIYNLAFEKKTEKIFLSDITGLFSMERDSVSVIRVYTEKAFIMALVAFIAFIVLAASARKKKIVAGEAWMMIVTAGACAIEPIIYISYFFSNKLQENFSAGSDGVRFRSFYGFLIYALPLLASALLIIAGFILLIRLAREKAVEVNIGEESAPEIADDTYTADYNAPVAQPQAEAVMQEVAMPKVQYAPIDHAQNEADNGADAVSMDTVAPPQVTDEPVTADIATQESISEGGTTEELQPLPLITHEPEQAQKVFCANCGQQLDPSARFCNNCGAKRN